MTTALSAPSRWDIGAIRSLDIVAMPLLAQHVNAHPQVLRDVLVLYINHAISDSLMVARALTRVGAQVTSVLVPYHGETGPAQHALGAAFDRLGVCLRPEPVHPNRFAAVMRAAVTDAIGHIGELAQRQNLPWLIVEDGGYAFPLLHDDPDLRPYLRRCLGAVEHTTRGRWNYEYAELDAIPSTARTLHRPAVTISGSALKTAHEAGFVAQGLLDEANYLLRRDHQFLRHRRVAVVGYGRVGRALAREIARLDTHVTVVDPTLPSTLDDGLTSATLVDAVIAGAFLIFGATGVSSFTSDALTAFLRHSRNDTLYLASASSKAIEFADLIALLDTAATRTAVAGDLAGGPATVTVDRDPAIGTRYRVHRAGGASKHLVVLGDGYPVIFYPADTHGAPNRAMDPVMTQLFLAAAGLPHSTALPAQVHDLDRLRTLPATTLPRPWQALLSEERLLADWCRHNGLHWPTYRQAINFTPPTQPARP